MKIKLITVGTHMPNWVQQAYHEYAKRLNNHLKIQLLEIPLNKRLKNSDINRLMAQESKQILQHIAASDCLITLEIKGKPWCTEQLAQNLHHWQQAGTDIALVIGGPEGLHADILQLSQQRWSLSPLTLPHPLVRVIVIEQIYRAWSINSGHPYHRS